MAQKIPFEDVVYFNLAGVGVIPGIVITSQLQQIPGTQDTEEVLSLLYAHPDDEQHAVHRAKDVGDVKFSVKPASETNHFGWADNADMTMTMSPEQQREWVNNMIEMAEEKPEPQPDVPAPTENPVTEPTPPDAVPEPVA